MRAETLALLKCPHCGSELRCAERGEVISGTVDCTSCRKTYPVLAGVLILVADVESYLLEHVKGISRYVGEKDIPKKYRADFIEAKRELEAEHIEEDLEAERVTALYIMTHYLRSSEVKSTSPLLDGLIKQHWDHGPFAKIKEMITALSGEKRSMIELGCGVGGLFVALQSKLQSYLGLDSSFASIVLARHFALGAPLSKQCLIPNDLLFGAVSREITIAPPKSMPSNADFIVCDLANPPVKEAQWQVAAALNVIDMLPEPAELPKLQYALLSSGGVAIQSCPYIWHPEVAEKLRRVLPKNIKDSAKAVEWLYEKNGFKIRSSEEHVPWLFYKNNRQIEFYSVHLFSGFKV